MKGAFGNEGALRFPYALASRAQPMKMRRDQRPNLVDGVRSCHRNTKNRDTCRGQGGINKLIACFAVRLRLRRIAQLDRHHRRESRVANQEIQMFRLNSIMLCSPSLPSCGGKDDVAQTHLGENSVVWSNPPQNFVKRTFG